MSLYRQYQGGKLVMFEKADEGLEIVFAPNERDYTIKNWNVADFFDICGQMIQGRQW